MKILFYDGNIRWWSRLTSFSNYNRLSASWGYTDNIKELNAYREKLGEDAIILTNSLVALDHRYGWNEKEHHTDIYFYVKSKCDFVRCDELTEKEYYWIRYYDAVHKGYNETENKYCKGEK